MLPKLDETCSRIKEIELKQYIGDQKNELTLSMKFYLSNLPFDQEKIDSIKADFQLKIIKTENFEAETEISKIIKEEFIQYLKQQQ